MQIANILLSLGGDHGNTIPKFAVTPAEIAVLRAIHGDESVNDIEPIGDVERTNRAERARIGAIYGHAKTAEQRPIVEGLFPGAAARVFETLEELDLPDDFYKATGRLTAKSVVKPAAVAEEAPAWGAGPREDGPTVAEWVTAGYSAGGYPPTGFASKSTAEEIAAAVEAEKAKTPAEPETDEADEPVGEDINDEHAETNVLG